MKLKQWLQKNGEALIPIIMVAAFICVIVYVAARGVNLHQIRQIEANNEKAKSRDLDLRYELYGEIDDLKSNLVQARAATKASENINGRWEEAWQRQVANVVAAQVKVERLGREASNAITVTNYVTISNVAPAWLFVEPEPKDTAAFEDGVKYGVIFARREPFEDSLAKLVIGARDLWQLTEVEKGTNTASAAFHRIFPKSTFEEGVEYGAAFAMQAIQARATNVTMEDIKAAAFRQKVMLQETNAPEPKAVTSNPEHRTLNIEQPTSDRLKPELQTQTTNAPSATNAPAKTPDRPARGTELQTQTNAPAK